MSIISHSDDSKQCNIESQPDYHQIVIAKNDAPKLSKVQIGENKVPSYSKGDQFKLISETNDYMIIWHHKTQYQMSVNKNSFIKLEELRNQKLNIILD